MVPNPANLSFVEDLYGEFLRDEASIPKEWRRYFERLERENGVPAGWRRGPSFRPRSLFDHAGTPTPGAEPPDAENLLRLQDSVVRLIRAHLVSGHMAALDRSPRLPETAPGGAGPRVLRLDRW